MKQPRKDVLRDQLALAADEIIELRSFLVDIEEVWAPKIIAASRADIAIASRRWWHRFAWWRA